MNQFINNKNSNYKIKNIIIGQYRYLCIYISFILTCFLPIFGWFNEELTSPLRYVITFITIISFNWSKWNKFKILIILFLFLSIIVRRLLVIWVIISLSYQILELKIPLKKIGKIGFLTYLIIILFLIELNLFAIIKNQPVIYEKFNRILYDLGTGNTNRTGLLFLSFFLYAYFVFNNKNLFNYIIFSLILSFIIFYITGCRTMFFSIIILNLFLIFEKFKLINNWQRFIYGLLPLIFLVGSFYLTYAVEDNSEINSTMSGRLGYIQRFTLESSVKDLLIGTVNESDSPLDSSYLALVVKGGLILVLFFSLGFLGSSIKFWNVNKKFLPVVTAILCSGITESTFSNLNSTSLLIWLYIIQFYSSKKIIYFYQLKN